MGKQYSQVRLGCECNPGYSLVVVVAPKPLGRRASILQGISERRSSVDGLYSPGQRNPSHDFHPTNERQQLFTVRQKQGLVVHQPLPPCSSHCCRGLIHWTVTPVLLRKRSSLFGQTIDHWGGDSAEKAWFWTSARRPTTTSLQARVVTWNCLKRSHNNHPDKKGRCAHQKKVLRARKSLLRAPALGESLGYTGAPVAVAGVLPPTPLRARGSSPRMGGQGPTTC